ncbi:MAG TPA: hydroxymethylbilane synthase [Candidatus Babeliaceae bacterium]|nr:hydroxymethylbilane synthase [Candidatus Babeliaceae bacterium]
MKKSHLTIATRESPLALWQANWVKTRLETIHPGISIQLLGITTKADKMLEIPLTQVGGKGLFVKELEEALLDKRADIAVHSMKDVPMDLPPGLCLPVMCEREEPRDVLVSNQFNTLNDLPFKAVIGTSSLRRQSQVSAMRPDLQIAHLRGNVNTRLSKLDNGEYAAIILAAAGLIRLGFQDRIQSYLSIDDSLPAAGQGVLGIECRENDAQILDFIRPLNHLNSVICVTAERAMCKRIGGGCQAPVAAYAEIKDKQLILRGLVARVDGSFIIRARQFDTVDQATSLGLRVADDLLAQGAEEILDCLLKKA